MPSVRYYGRILDEDRFDGRLGSVVRGLNRARAFVERVTEGAVAAYEARQQGIPVKPILRKIAQEGLIQPIDILVRPPVTVGRTHAEAQPGFESRFYRGRDYSARVGRKATMAARDTPEVQTDDTLSLFARYDRHQYRGRRSHRGVPALSNESFRKVVDDET